MWLFAILQGCLLWGNHPTAARCGTLKGEAVGLLLSCAHADHCERGGGMETLSSTSNPHQFCLHPLTSPGTGTRRAHSPSIPKVPRLFTAAFNLCHFPLGSDSPPPPPPPPRPRLLLIATCPSNSLLLLLPGHISLSHPSLQMCFVPCPRTAVPSIPPPPPPMSAALAVALLTVLGTVLPD